MVLKVRYDFQMALGAPKQGMHQKPGDSGDRAIPDHTQLAGRLAAGACAEGAGRLSERLHYTDFAELCIFRHRLGCVRSLATRRRAIVGGAPPYRSWSVNGG